MRINNIFRELSQKHIFFDTHIHPFDVLGCCDSSTKKNKNTHTPTLLERMQFGRFALGLLEFLFKFVPAYMHSEIKKPFGDAVAVLRAEMKKAGITKMVLVPVLPYVSTQKIFDTFSNSEILLGTVDIHKWSLEEIEDKIVEQIQKYGIRGIKLHPNIQGFFPLPNQNSIVVGEKLKKVYQVINQQKLYVLIHAGFSFVKNGTNFKKVSFAHIANFVNTNGNLFKLIKTPIILAHMGKYNVVDQSNEVVGRIVKKYNHVYVDTAGVAYSEIGDFMSDYGYEKIVFGSDALYFNIAYNVNKVLDQIALHVPKRKWEDAIIKIFSSNYQKILSIK